LTVYVDPEFPAAWRDEPYHSWLRNYAFAAVDIRQQLIVRINDRVIVLLPGKEVDLGLCAKDDNIFVHKAQSGDWTAVRVPAMIFAESAS
jgi:hypothetical protein